MSTLRAFVVRNGLDYETTAALVYAESGRQAKALGWKHGDLEAEEFIELRVRRAPAADRYASEVGVERDRKILRLAGWRMEDEYTCGSCGLGAMGQDEFAVCLECYQCKECGCEDGCKQSQSWSCE